MRKQKSILFLSDIHYIHPKNRVPIDDVRFVLQLLELLASWAKYLWFRINLAERLKTAWYKVNRTYIRQTFLQIAKSGPYNEVVVLGDQANGHKDQGMVTDLSRQEGRTIKRIIRKFFGRLIALSGGHETGWILASGAWGQGGISQQSLEAWQEIYGSMYGAKKIAPGLNLIWLSSEPFMIRKKWKHCFRPEQWDWLLTQRQTELAFLQDTLKRTNKDRFVLAIHDSSALLSPFLQQVLEPYRDQLLTTLCGHFHARWVANLYYYCHFANRRFKEAAWKYKVQVIPSIWGIVVATPLGFWHPGAGWAELLIRKGGEISLLIHYLSRRKTKTIELGSIV